MARRNRPPAVARRSTNLALLDRVVDREDGSRLPVSLATEALDRARAERVEGAGRSTSVGDKG